MGLKFTLDHRRHWRILALAVALALHTWILGELYLHQPVPAAARLHSAPPVPEWDYTFEPAPPPPRAQPIPVTAPIPPAPRPRLATPTLRQRLPPQVPATDATEYAERAPELPPPTATDLLQQIPGVAAQSLPPARSGRPMLDLGVRAAPDGGPIRAQRTQAGLGGAPTRGASAPVGDLANGMLIEQWQGLHHDGGSTDCSRQQASETMAMYIARCKS